MSRVSVIGAGAWGTTLAILLAEKNHAVTLWAYEKDLVAEMLERRENRRFLPGFQLPENIELTNDIRQAAKADLIFLVIPVQFLRPTLKQLKGQLQPGTIVTSASKGIELKTLQLPLQIIQAELGLTELAVLSGPNLSAEIARGLPAASVVAATQKEIAKTVQTAVQLDRFRTYVNLDPAGVQLGGSLKNIVAIAAGIASGLELGQSALAGLIIRGIAEITRLGVAMGAQAKTFAGLSGMGDLIVTCSSKLSRNHYVGEQVASGKKLADILNCMGHVAEGVSTVKAALELAEKYKVELPIAREVYATLYQGKNPYQAINDLMTRSATSE